MVKVQKLLHYEFVSKNILFIKIVFMFWKALTIGLIQFINFKQTETNTRTKAILYQ